MSFGVIDPPSCKLCDRMLVAMPKEEGFMDTGIRLIPVTVADGMKRQWVCAECVRLCVAAFAKQSNNRTKPPALPPRVTA